MSNGRQRRHAVLRAPLLHFLLAGSVLFALQTIAWPERRVASEPSAASLCENEIDARGSAFAAAANDDAERDEEILVREALRLGLDDDAVIQRRLADNLAFLGQSTAPAHVVDALRSTDPIVRRRLVQKMRFHLASTIAVDTPSDGEVAAFAAQHGAEADVAETVAVQQIFFSSERRGARAHTDAHALLQDLRADPQQAVRAQADSLHIGLDEANTLGGVGRYLGRAFVDELADATHGTWNGPVASPFGYHLVRLDSPPAIDMGAKARQHMLALRRLQAERRDAAFERRMGELRAASESSAVRDSPSCR